MCGEREEKRETELRGPCVGVDKVFVPGGTIRNSEHKSCRRLAKCGPNSLTYTIHQPPGLRRCSDGLCRLVFPHAPYRQTSITYHLVLPSSQIPVCLPGSSASLMLYPSLMLCFLIFVGGYGLWKGPLYATASLVTFVYPLSNAQFSTTHYNSPEISNLPLLNWNFHFEAAAVVMPDISTIYLLACKSQSGGV